MQRHIISVTSITYAIKGRDFLRKNGIRAYTERKSDLNNGSGCGYVIIAYGNQNRIIDNLHKIGIKILDINTVA